MILHTLASHDADRVQRRGLRHQSKREYRFAMRAKIDMLTQIRMQAAAAGNHTDVTNISAAIIDCEEAIRATQ